MRYRAALVAYEHSDGTYDLHRSDRLGRDLHEAWRITEVTPNGYSQCDEEVAFLETDPIESGMSFQQIVDTLDYASYSAVVVVSESYEVIPYRALWFGFADSCADVCDSARVGHGALVRLPDIHHHPERDISFCTRYEATKRTLGGLVDDGVLSLEVARKHLRSHVALLDEERDVVFASGTDPRRLESSSQSAVTSILNRVLGWKWATNS